ncbi:MAG: signal peptide peptidase SppA [Leptospiraceae bacterium]|nr:signal peptide peptidase SppA [Leptospiraceae bacterium]
MLGMIHISIQAKGKISKTGNVNVFKTSLESAILLKVEGEIHSGKSTYQSTGADTVLAKLREIEDNNEIKGVLIEINSPGGTVGASQEIFEQLMYLREKKNKKVVVSMKDLAASGGYYIASAADYIYTEAGTITGSIGVITVSPNISGLLKKYSVEMRVYKAGKYKDILSMFKDSTEEEDAIIEGLLSDTYNRFISDVARGRKKKVSTIEKLAEGKIYSGEAAVKNKLVDEIGGRREAFAKLTELCGVTNLQLLEDEDSPFDRFFNVLGAKLSILSGLGSSNSFNIKSLKSPILLIMPGAFSIQEF